MVKHERNEIETTMKTKERLLELYGWIADLYMIDFFVDDHWNRLPSSWRYCFDNFDAISWFNVLNNTNSGNLNIKDIDSSNTDSKHILPLSFICFKRLIDTVSLERKPVNGLKQLAELLEIDAQYLPHHFPSIDETDKELKRKVKPKKQHEINRICHTLELLQATTSSKFDEILDIGAGLGHLSRYIAVKFSQSNNTHLSITSIDANQQFVQKSQQLDSSLTKKLNRSNQKDAAHNIHTLERKTLLLEDGRNYRHDDNEERTKCIIGLHSCGSLSVHIIKQFITDPNIGFLLNFGCCYHKFNSYASDHFDKSSVFNDTSSVNCELIDRNKDPNEFPLSSTYSHFKLSYAAKELSCHAMEHFISKLRDNKCMKDYDIHCYRAILERLMVNYYRNKYKNFANNDEVYGQLINSHRHQQMKNVKQSAFDSFSSYLQKALSDKPQLLNDIRTMLQKDPSMQSEVDVMLAQSHRLLSLYCIRLLLAKLTETLILEDRYCFIRENGFRAHLIPLFDPCLSPRNIVIISYK